jgi:hypothetical protein
MTEFGVAAWRRSRHRKSSDHEQGRLACRARRLRRACLGGATTAKLPRRRTQTPTTLHFRPPPTALGSGRRTEGAIEAGRQYAYP